MLSEANQRWHDLLDRRYQHFLETLTALDLPLAQQQWTVFKHALIQHIDFEHTHIEPLAETWESNTLKLIKADHLILERLIPRLEQTLSEINAANEQRSVLVTNLDGFIKMRNVLAHHDQREMEYLYPLLDQQLDHTLSQTLVQQMDEAIEALQ